VINFISLFLFYLVIFPLSAQATSIQVSGAHWKGYIEPNDKGIYVDLIKLVYKDEAVNFDIGSFARAKRMFNAKKSDVLVGIYESDLLDFNDVVLPNHHLDIEYPTIVIFNPKKNKINNINDLKGLTVSWFEEYGYEKLIPEEAIRYPFNDINYAFTLLVSGRVDAIVDHDYNLNEREKLIFKTWELAPERPIWLAFQDTKRGKKLKNLFDERIKYLISTGQVKKIFGDEYERANFDKVYPKTNK
jgi:polar amino acid transport system substrate-binding protein